MAQRFGGKFSPDMQPTVTGSRPLDIGANLVRTAEKRARYLGFTAFAFFFPAFSGTPNDLILSLIAGGLILLAAWLTREGARAQAAYDARRVARRPALPRKFFGAAILGAAIFTGALMSYPGFALPLILGAVAVGLHLLTFGPDPMRDKGLEGVDQFQVDRVSRAVDDAEAYLAAMQDAILRANDRKLETRVAQFATTARTLFRTVEGDPGDLTAARKYLSVFLMGARDASVKFADHYAQTKDAKARADYEALLGDLETTFAQRTTQLLSGADSDLDVEIEVLRDRLKLET